MLSIAAELEDLRALVASLRVSMSELTNNTDPAERGVLEVNVRDARAGLSRGVQRLTPITQASMVSWHSEVPAKQTWLQKRTFNADLSSYRNLCRQASMKESSCRHRY